MTKPQIEPASFSIEEAGFYEIEAADYHADPCPQPSLSNSVAGVLLERCSAAARYAHPRLNALHVEKHRLEFDRGTVAHRLLLGKGREFRVVDAADFRTKQAQIQRDTLREAGFTPISAPQWELVTAMVGAAKVELESIEDGKFAFTEAYGRSELCAAWQDTAGPWGRALIDWYGAKVPSGLQCWDYKTTDGPANPGALSGWFARQNYAMQAAFQERGIVHLKPDLAGRIKFRFLIQETEPPYLCSVVEPDAAAMTIAHKMVAAAFVIWQRCLTTNQWPGYPRHPQAISITPGLEARWLARELEEEFAHTAEGDKFLSSLVWGPADTGAQVTNLEDSIVTPRSKSRRRKSHLPGVLGAG